MIKPSVIKAIREAVGPGACLDAPEDLRCYSYDLYARSFPELVVLPKDEAEIVKVLSIAHEENIPVTPRGAASSLTGASVPLKGGLSLGLAGMNRILDISSTDRTARVQPGVVTQVLQQTVARQGLLYPPDPASSPFCTIGGNVATNAGGPSGLKYGVTRDYLLGLSLVLPGGDKLVTGGRTLKNVTGYDFTHFICGSEGQLGVISEVTLRLLPRPETVRTFLVHFASLQAAVDSVTRIMGSGFIPATLELMDHFFLQAVDRLYDLGFPKGVRAALLIEVDGSRGQVREAAEVIAGLIQTPDTLRLEKAERAADREKLWMARRSGTAALMRDCAFMITLDCTVPVSAIVRAVQAIHRVAEEQAIQVVLIGHAGDGNLHPMFIYDPEDPVQVQAFSRAEADLCAMIIDLGGTLSGEHGIGLEKAGFLSLQLSPVQLKLSKCVKRVFDPRLIMNPGKCEWAENQTITPPSRIK
ncbi:MAG: FAD-binding oxidoreductase [Thermodesulfobacteriota bacterium]